jgi:hypothetical protein
VQLVLADSFFRPVSAITKSRSNTGKSLKIFFFRFAESQPRSTGIFKVESSHIIYNPYRTPKLRAVPVR